MALGGRPKEKGGHKPLKISVDKFVREGLEKVGNKSQFLEKVARPILEEMDPGEASFFVWQIDIFISQGIIEATKKGNFKLVNNLGWLANCLEDARKLCSVPPPNFNLPSTKTASPEYASLWKDVEEGQRLYMHARPISAWKLLYTTCCKLPSYEAKQKVLPTIKRFNAEFEKLRKQYGSLMMVPNKILPIYNRYVPMLIEAISATLYTLES